MKNKSLKYLNIYGNIIDVAGCLKLAKYISCTETLEFLDVGYNRIRNKGLDSITKAMVDNKNCKLTTIGLKFNFISENHVIEMLKALKAKKDYQLSQVYLKNNNINEFGLKTLYKAYNDNQCKAYIDLFDKFKYTDEERLSRTIWVMPVPSR